MEPLNLLAANYLIYGAVSLVSDQVYRYFKFSGGPLDMTNFCFYDNYFYGWYYTLATGYYLLLGAFLGKAQIPPRNPLWRLLKLISLFSFFIECEAVLQFVYVSRDIEYQVEELHDQQMIYAFVILGVIRWSVALFAMNHVNLALEYVCHEAYGYTVTGSGFTINRTRMNGFYGWLSQYLADYIVVHYLLYTALYSPSSPLYILSSDQFARYEVAAPFPARALTGAYFTLAGIFYTTFARKEFTFLSHIV